MYHCDTFDMSLAWRRLWKHMGARGAASTDVVGREGVGLRALRAATADWGLRIAEAQTWRRTAETHKLRMADSGFPDFLMDRLDSLRRLANLASSPLFFIFFAKLRTVG